MKETVIYENILETNGAVPSTRTIVEDYSIKLLQEIIDGGVAKATIITVPVS